MTATMTARRRRVMDSVTETVHEVNWTRVINATFWTTLGLFWTGFAFLYFISGGWYILGGVLFGAMALAHFGMATLDIY